MPWSGRPFKWLGQVLRHPIRSLRLFWPFSWSRRTVILLVMQTLDNSMAFRARRQPFRRDVDEHHVGVLRHHLQAGQAQSRSAFSSVRTYSSRGERKPRSPNDLARSQAVSIASRPRKSQPRILADEHGWSADLMRSSTPMTGQLFLAE